MYKPLADSTLERKSKKELIQVIRCLEHNWFNAKESINDQANNYQKLLTEVEEEYKTQLKNIKTSYDSTLRLKEKEWLDKYIALQQNHKESEFYTLEEMKAMSESFISNHWAKVQLSLAMLAQEENNK